MSFFSLIVSLFGFYFICFSKQINAADVLVQLNVNRPLNDVNEKFVSFAIKPEELYRALDGDNRRIITRMAAMLGESYVKFTNDYNFAMDTELKLRNPTKIIWKGFNRWARAVNWTMVVPVPYEPETWDPMETLRILNSSYLNGITDCIWQLGTDFGSSHAEDYVAELSTLSLMVDNFKPYVDDWRIMGADISAGSSAEETLRYIEMSKDLNSAFGWTQPSDATTTNSLVTISQENDPALSVLVRQKVPVWLTMPPKIKTRISNGVMTSDEATDALLWAKMLGDAASTGFDAVFKQITAADLERPNFSYYVSALFKKVMGSRVFPARPLNMYAKTNKLYTHCANTVSGGIAFMIVNSNENALQVQVHSMSKMTATEVWQYTLTMKKGSVLLNDQRLFYNSTLRPHKAVKQANKAIVLSTPGRSVSFWVLPTANLEHCQYTEVVTDELDKDADTEETNTEKRYSSSDKLLRTLIQEASLTKNPLARAISRRRRYATATTTDHKNNNSRTKRFVLKEKHNTKKQQEVGWGKLFKPFAHVSAIEEPPAAAVEESVMRKRENIVAQKQPATLLRKPSPFDWFKDLMENTMSGDLPLLRRGARSIDGNDDDDDGDNYFGPMFATKDGKATKPFTKKITEIKKQELKTKPLFDADEFDEEEFFQKLSSHREPEYPRLPDGDVILKLITNPDGDEIEEDREEQVEKMTNSKTKLETQSHEVINEMKPIKLLPTELYEGLPLNPFKPAQNNFGGIGGALNSLLFPEPFLKKPAKTKKVISIEKDLKSKESKASSSLLAKEFLKTQQALSMTFAEDNQQSNEGKEKVSESKTVSTEQTDEVTTTKTSEETTTTPATNSDAKASSTEIEEAKKPVKFGYQEFFADNIENYFGEQEVDSADAKLQTDEVKPKFDEVSWWDMSPLSQQKLRTRRALLFDLADSILHNNFIGKDEELVPLGAMIPPEKIATYEYRAENGISSGSEKQEASPDQRRSSTESGLVATFKDKITNIVDIFSRHLGDWYNTLTKNLDSSVGGVNRERAETPIKTTASSNNNV